MTVAGQTLVDYDWFRNDLLKTITQGTATVTMAYDQANRLDTTTLANGIVQDYTLDGAGGITQISYDKGATAYGKINHASDAAGRRTDVGRLRSHHAAGSHHLDRRLRPREPAHELERSGRDA
jgi:YD repeat-containing protein